MNELSNKILNQIKENDLKTNLSSGITIINLIELNPLNNLNEIKEAIKLIPLNKLIIKNGINHKLYFLNYEK